MKPALNRKIRLFRGSITSLSVDGIVNAANERGLGGGGVDAVIHAAAGPQLLAECRKLGGIPTGTAKITKAYRLHAKAVIHAVGPRGQDAKALEATYRAVLEQAKKARLRSLALPCISTGIFGFPNELAASVALFTVRRFLESDPYGDKVTPMDAQRVGFQCSISL